MPRQRRFYTRDPVVVSALPASAAEGQVVDLLTPPSSVGMLRFKYSSAANSTYPWFCIGGTPLQNFATGQLSTTASATAYQYTAAITTPTLTLPWLGYYDCEYHTTAIAGQDAADYRVSAFLNTVSTQFMSVENMATAFNGRFMQSHGRWRGWNQLAAGATMLLGHCTAQGIQVNLNYYDRMISAMPIQVAGTA